MRVRHVSAEVLESVAFLQARNHRIWIPWSMDPGDLVGEVSPLPPRKRWIEGPLLNPIPCASSVDPLVHVVLSGLPPGERRSGPPTSAESSPIHFRPGMRDVGERSGDAQLFAHRLARSGRIGYRSFAGARYRSRVLGKDAGGVTE